MFPTNPNLYLLVWKEQYQDRQREAERERLIRIARRQVPGPRRLKPHRTVASWMGQQLVRWGQKLQNYGSVNWSQLAGTHLGNGAAGANAREE
jgi:hypothetical protein